MEQEPIFQEEKRLRIYEGPVKVQVKERPLQIQEGP